MLCMLLSTPLCDVALYMRMGHIHSASQHVTQLTRHSVSHSLTHSATQPGIVYQCTTVPCSRACSWLLSVYQCTIHQCTIVPCNAPRPLWLTEAGRWGINMLFSSAGVAWSISGAHELRAAMLTPFTLVYFLLSGSQKQASYATGVRARMSIGVWLCCALVGGCVAVLLCAV